MQSVDEFTPSTTEPVFGSGLISQGKSQTSTNNDTNEIIPPSGPVVNGQNEAAINKLTLSENIINGTKDASTVQVNGDHDKPTVEVNNEAKSAPAVEQPVAPGTEPEPVSSTPMDTGNEVSSTAVDKAPVVEEPTTTAVEAVTDTAAEVPIATESEPAEVKSKSPRGKAKAPAVVAAPTRQSTRGRKPASSSTAEESVSADETSSSSSSQRTKRQAATAAKDAIAASNEANSTDDVLDEAVGNAAEGPIVASPSPGRKRGPAKAVTPASAKKARGQDPVTPIDDVNTEAQASEDEPVQTPPAKKARTSATKKTPEPPGEEYARKLRPRK